MIMKAFAHARKTWKSARSRWSALPWGLWGALALLVLIEGAIVRLEPGLLQPWHWDWRFSGSAATRAGSGAAILCIGDSMVLNGLLPRVVEQACGQPTYNLAVSGGHTASSYFLFKRVLRSGARPSAVLIGRSPLALHQEIDSGYLLRQWPELLGTAETANLAWNAGDARLFGAVTAARVLPSLRLRAEIRTLAANRRKLTSRFRHTSFVMTQFLRNRDVNGGALVLPPKDQHHDSELFRSGFHGTFQVDPLSAAYLDRLLTLAAVNQVRVFWVMPPAAGPIQDACDRSGFENQRTAFIRDLQRRHPGLVVLDGRRAGYHRDVYSRDPLHLNETGAALFSAGIAQALMAEFVGRSEAWAMLPAYHPEETPEIENFDESAVAVRGSEAGSRLASLRR
jgi:hypothetical protein